MGARGCQSGVRKDDQTAFEWMGGISIETELNVKRPRTGDEITPAGARHRRVEATDDYGLTAYTQTDERTL